MLLKQLAAGVLTKKEFMKANRKIDERAKHLEDEAGASGSVIELSSSSDEDKDSDDDSE